MSEDESREVQKRSGDIEIPYRLIGLGVLVALVLVFVFQNTEKGNVTFLFWDVDAPAWLWILATFAVGVMVGTLMTKVSARRRRNKD